MKGLVIGVITLFAVNVFADVIDLRIVDNGNYISKRVISQTAKAVELTLKKEVKHRDCIEPTAFINTTQVSGRGDGYFDTYFLDVEVAYTEPFCEYGSGMVTTTLSTQPFVVKPKDELVVNVVYPEGFELVVKKL